MDNENGNGSLRDALKRVPPLPVDLDEEVRRMRTPTPRVSDFAPQPPTDPVRLASLTLKSVHKIGFDSAAEIREVADLVLSGAQEVAKNLNDLADAVAGHSDVAHQNMQVHCQRLTSVLEGARKLAEALNAPVPDTTAPTESAASSLIANDYQEPST